MAPEAFLDGLYSSSSDVWSFGVVVWEIFTDAVQPFFGLPNHQVIANILQVWFQSNQFKLFDLFIVSRVDYYLNLD